MEKQATVAKWHAWLDKPGMRHSFGLWQYDEELGQGTIVRQDQPTFHSTSAEDIVEYVGRNRLYVLCRDILDADDFPHGDKLLEHPKSETYLQKHGKIVAVRVKAGRYSGFLIPSRTWGAAVPSQELIEDMQDLFRFFQFEGITPGSISEKVLRSTLGEHHTIYRPCVDVRNVLLRYNEGGRIDEISTGALYPTIYTYDLKSAYLYFSRRVPTPFQPPYYHFNPDARFILDFPVGFWLVEMVAHGTGIHPIYIHDERNGNRCNKRFPQEGERFVKWMWSGTIRDCVEKGYTLLHVERGYRWKELSDFMASWSDILYDAYQKVGPGRETLKSMIKSMWVSLPGRFLKQPISYNLIGQQDVRSGDIPIASNWFHFHENWNAIDANNLPKFFTNWYVRPEYDKESTALTPVGAYIVEECRRAIYRKQVEEEAKGNKVLSSYIDSISFKQRASFLHEIGIQPGQWTEEISEQGWLDMNRFVRQVGAELEMRMPGQSGENRVLLLHKYRQICEKEGVNLTEI